MMRNSNGNSPRKKAFIASGMHAHLSTTNDGLANTMGRDSTLIRLESTAKDRQQAH